MDLVSGLIEHLRASPLIAGALGDRIHPSFKPDTGYPFLIVQEIPGYGYEHNTKEGATVSNPRVRFDAYTETRAQAMTIRDGLHSELFQKHITNVGRCIPDNTPVIMHAGENESSITTNRWRLIWQFVFVRIEPNG